MTNPAGWLAVVAGSILLAELLARAGTAAAAWWFPRPRHRLSRWGIAVLTGLAAWGALFLGLALAGLFFPGVIVVTALAVAVPARGCRRAFSAEAVRGWAGIALLPAIALAIAGALIAAPSLLPETSFDSVVYHLGAPWQYLQAHRALLFDVPLQFHFPLPVEMTYALPLSLGDDRLARALMVIAFVAANAVFAGRLLARGRATAAWTGPVLVLAAPSIAWVVSLAKSDIAAAGWLVAGMLLTADGVWAAGSLFLGCALAGKLAYAPAIAVWIVAVRPDARRVPRAVLGLALPLAGWLAKTWLATGTPVFPFSSALIPSPFWGPGQAEAWRAYVHADWPADTLELAAIPLAWVRHMAHDYLLALFFLPVLFVVARTGQPPRPAATAAVIIGMLGILGTGHLTRFLIPLAW